MTTQGRWRTPEYIASTLLDEETVIVDLRGGAIYTLNQVGSTIWRALAAGASDAEIVRRIVAEYEVSQMTAQADTASLLHELAVKGLIIPAGGDLGHQS